MAREQLDRMSSPDQKMIETQEAIEEIRQQEDDLKNEMIANNDNSDPPLGITFSLGHEKGSSKSITLNGTNIPREGLKYRNTYIQIGKSVGTTIYGLEFGVEGGITGLYHQNNFKYIKDETANVEGRGGGVSLKVSVGIGGEHCYDCDAGGNNLRVVFYGMFNYDKILANGEVICDCTGNVLLTDKVRITNKSFKIGAEFIFQGGLKIGGYIGILPNNTLIMEWENDKKNKNEIIVKNIGINVSKTF